MERNLILGDRFELAQKVGKGGMGEVYRARDTHTGETVAIKMLSQEAINKAPDAIERFMREGTALRKLGHPRIVKLLDAVVENNQYYIIMEYIGDGSLMERIQRESKLPINDVLKIGLGVADALTWTHSEAIIHRDIKPHNILLAKDGTPRLTDFGVAHLSDLSAITQVGQLVGTWFYLSPEACRAQPLDERTDIWALGVVLYEMLAGRRPFVGSQPTAVVQSILNDPVPSLRQFRSDVPDALAQLIYRMLEKDLNRRIRSARQVGTELEMIERSNTDRSAKTIHLADSAAPRPAPHDLNKRRPDISMPGPVDFDISIDDTGSGYMVYARGALDLGTLSPQPFIAPFALSEMSDRRRDVAEWIRQARVTRLSGNEGLRQGRAFGGDLFNRLFVAELLKAFDESRTLLPPNERLRIRLRLPDSLTPLPWELLCDPRTSRFLALEYKLTLVRYPKVSTRIAPLRVPLPLQVVAVLASPGRGNYPPIKLDRERLHLQAALKEPIKRGQIGLEFISGPDTLRQLSARLQRPVHVLHFLCHGESDRTTGTSRLIFEDAEGGIDPVDAEALPISLQRQQEAPRLVVINACLGAFASDDNPFSSVGAGLFRSGVPAVIAMQFELAEDTAAELTRVFYTELTTGKPVDLALTEARLRFAEQYPHLLDWCIPVLFLRTDDGVLFDTDMAEPHLTPPKQPLNRNDPRLRQARYEAATGQWSNALELYQALDDAFTLPDDIADALERARREMTLLRIRNEAAAAEAQHDWATAINRLNRLTQLNPTEAKVADRLKHARSEQQLMEWAQQAADAIQNTDWTQALVWLDRILQRHPGYIHPTIDLEGLRHQAQAGQAHEQALEHAEQHNWGSVIATLSLVENTALDDNMRTLLAHAYAEQLNLIRQDIDVGSFDSAFAQLEARIAIMPTDSSALEIVSSIIEQPRAPLKQRLYAARMAARTDDLRFGVSRLPPAMVRIEGGSFVIGSTHEETERVGRALERYYSQQGDQAQARVASTWTEDAINNSPLTLRSFEIARYLVTNAQYALFIEDNGYDPDQPWWSGEAQYWLQQTGVRSPAHWDDESLGKAQRNHPVVGVSWYEAQAFCRWLTQHSKHNPQHEVYRLPTEAEWEFAARGTERRLYPWGMSGPDSSHTSFDKQYHATTPVGCFVVGATPVTRIYDLAGNVWEWTGSVYKSYPYDPRDGREQLDNLLDKSCTIRGGGWRSPPMLMLASHRHHYPPDNYDDNLGFRLARTIPLK